MSKRLGAVRNWCIKYPLAFSLLFLCVYLVWFEILEKYVRPYHMIHTGLDQKIPFCAPFIIPYLLWFLYVAGTFLYFFLKDKNHMLDFCRYEFTGLILCLIIYTIYPTGISLRPELTGTDIFTKLVALVYANDTATNVCPSIHVFASLVTNTIIFNFNGYKRPKLVKGGSLILCILICLSTMFLKQHSVVDVFWGSALALTLSPLASRETMSVLTGYVSKALHSHAS